MTEQDKEKIIQLWNNRVAVNRIIQLLPYERKEIMREINRMKLDGSLDAKNRIPTMVERIGEAYKSGTTNPYELAKVFGVSRAYINAALWQCDIYRKRPPHNYSSVIRQEIVKELDKGTSPVDIARKVGVSRQYVYSVRSEYNASEQTED